MSAAPRKGRKLLVASLGVAAVSYVGCSGSSAKQSAGRDAAPSDAAVSRSTFDAAASRYTTGNPVAPPPRPDAEPFQPPPRLDAAQFQHHTGNPMPIPSSHRSGPRRGVY